MNRLPDLSPEAITDSQRQVLDEIQGGPRGSAAYGPFLGWLWSPPFTDHAQRMGAYLRFETVLDARLKELAILYVGRLWTAQFEWFAHKKFALNAGLGADIIDAIEQRRRPDFVKQDEAAVYDFVAELHDTRRVSDAGFAAAREHLGDAGVAELVGVVGYYTLVSMTLNAFEIPMPDGSPGPLAP